MTTITSAGTGNWSAGATWVGGVAPTTNQDSVIVAAGHTITGDTDFIVAAGAFLHIDPGGTLNIDSAHTLTFNATSWVTVNGTLDFAADTTFDGTWDGVDGAVSVDGSIVFTTGMNWSMFIAGGSSFTCDGGAGVHTITYNGVTAPAITVDNAGTTSLTAQDACTAAAFTLTTNGVYSTGGFAHNIGGTINIAGGVLSGGGTWTQTADGNFANATYGNIITKIVFNAAATLTAYAFVKAVGGTGSVALAAQWLRIYPAANDFYDATCTYTATTGQVNLKLEANRTNAAAMNFSAVKVVIQSVTTSNNAIFTSAGRVTCGELIITGTGNGYYAHLSANGGLDAGAVTLGTAASTTIGKLSLAGVCSLTSLAAAGTSTAHQINFGSSSTKLSGTITGTNILPTSNGAHVHGGVLTGIVVPAGDIIHRFAPGADNGNTGAIVNCPSPIGPGAALMAA